MEHFSSSTAGSVGDIRPGMDINASFTITEKAAVVPFLELSP